MKYLVLALSFFFSVSAFAQAEQPQTEPAKKSRKKRTEQGAEAPGRTMKPSRGAGKLAESYPDSVEFNKAFGELYTMLKSKETVQEKAEQAFKQISRTFSRAGIDSAEAYRAVMAKIDPNMEREIIFRIYRTNMNAEELNGWIAFLRTPAGKKILEVGEKVIGAHEKQVDAQVRRAVNTAVTPLRKTRTVQSEGNKNAVQSEAEVPPPPPARDENED